MRTLAALTIYVSLLNLNAYGGPAPPVEPSWRDLREQGLAAVDRRDLEIATGYFERSWKAARTPAQLGTSANDLGVSLHQFGRDKEAAPWLERALAVWKSDPAQRVHAGSTSEALACAYRNIGEYSRAEQLLREALAGPIADPEEKSIILNTLGDILREEGRRGESKALFDQSARIPGVSWKRLAESQLGLADLDRDARLWQESITEWNAAGDLAREHHDASLEAIVWRGLGETWFEQGNPARAEPLLRRALAAFETDSRPEGNQGNQVSATLSCLAQLYLGVNKLALAEDALTRALDGEERTLGVNHPQVAILLEILADTVARRKQMDRAREYFERAGRIMADKFGENSATAGAVLASWGAIEQRSGDAGRAAAQFEKSLAILQSGGPDAERLRLFVMRHYAEVLKATHHKQEASAMFAQVKSFRGK